MRNRRLFITALLGTWLLLLVPNAGAGQDTATAPVSIDVDAPSPTVSTTAAVPPTVAVPASTVTQTVTPVPTLSSTPTPAATATVAPTTTPTPAAQLSTAISPTIECVVSSTASEVVQGGSIDYRCSIAVDLSGTDLDGETALLDWSLSATTSTRWSVQIRLSDQSWSSAGSTASLEDERELDAIAPIALMADVRIHRETCVTGAATVSLASSVTVQLLGANGAASGSPVQGTSTGEIAPQLAAIPEPQLSFAGSLDFGQVSPATWGDAVSANGEITLIVSGLSSSCGTWNVVLSGSVLQASNGSTIPVGNLALTAVDNVPVSAGSCPLAGGCLVIQLVAGPRAVDTESFLLSLSLTVPPETLSASFSSSITASIVAD